ncbi:MAG: hypothetical protein QXV23_07305 [Candidatus Bathyarchaeia archaeon]
MDTSELDWEFESGSFTSKDVGNDWTCDSSCNPPSISNIRQGTKDIASTTGEFVDSDGDGDLDTLKVTVSNAYPCYYNHIDFWVHNNGEVPLIISKVIIDGHVYTASPVILCLDLNGDGNLDIIIRYGNSFGTQLEYCDSANISFDFHILQNAPEGQSLSFTIQIVAENWSP